MRKPHKNISHGVKPTLEKLNQAIAGVRELNAGADLPFSFAITSRTSRFGYLFPDLQTADALLPEVPEMRAHLINLGATMVEAETLPNADSTIPSAYTYLGQFVDHDITMEAKSNDIVKL